MIPDTRNKKPGIDEWLRWLISLLTNPGNGCLRMAVGGMAGGLVGGFGAAWWGISGEAMALSECLIIAGISAAISYVMACGQILYQKFSPEPSNKVWVRPSWFNVFVAFLGIIATVIGAVFSIPFRGMYALTSVSGFLSFEAGIMIGVCLYALTFSGQFEDD